MKGLQMTKHVKSISDLNNMNLAKDVNGAAFNDQSFIVKKGFFADRYDVNINMDLTSMKGTGDVFGITNSLLSQIKMNIIDADG